jgi:hypothetical protein
MLQVYAAAFQDLQCNNKCIIKIIIYFRTNEEYYNNKIYLCDYY